jgi:hypothetical protein
MHDLFHIMTWPTRAPARLQAGPCGPPAPRRADARGPPRLNLDFSQQHLISCTMISAERLSIAGHVPQVQSKTHQKSRSATADAGLKIFEEIANVKLPDRLPPSA